MEFAVVGFQTLHLQVESMIVKSAWDRVFEKGIEYLTSQRGIKYLRNSSLHDRQMRYLRGLGIAISLLPYTATCMRRSCCEANSSCILRLVCSSTERADPARSHAACRSLT